MSATEQRRRAYLQAIGVDVWVSREAHDEAQPAAQARGLSQGEPAARVAPTSVPPAQVPPVSVDAGEAHRWALLQNEVMRCTRCRLHETRTQAVFGVGDRRARLMIIGEAPGAEEDRQGEPFVGAAGAMLDAMLRAIGLQRRDVFIANVLKCRPPQNRDPRSDESEACADYLQRQIATIQPQLILALGRVAAQHLLRQDAPLGKLRGGVKTLPEHEIPVMVTYHPAYLLRTPTQKAAVWHDLRAVHRALTAA